MSGLSAVWCAVAFAAADTGRERAKAALWTALSLGGRMAVIYVTGIFTSVYAWYKLEIDTLPV